MRLPLFFLISGFLSAAAIKRPWKKVARSRVASPYYLYVLWAIPLPLLYAALDSVVLYGRIESVPDALKVLLVPNSSLWYLFALAAYFVVAKSLAWAPQRVVLLVILTLSMSIATWGGDSVMAGIGHYPFFYLLGAYFPNLINLIAEDRRVIVSVLAALAYACVLATYVLGWQDLFGVRTLCGAVGAWAGLIAASRSAAAWGWIGKGLTKLGTQTLPIFILHYPLLALVGVPVVAWAGSMPTAAAWALPAGLVALLVLASLIIHRLLVALGLGLLFRLPEFSASQNLRESARPAR